MCAAPTESGFTISLPVREFNSPDEESNDASRQSASLRYFSSGAAAEPAGHQPNGLVQRSFAGGTLAAMESTDDFETFYGCYAIVCEESGLTALSPEEVHILLRRLAERAEALVRAADEDRNRSGDAGSP